MFFPFAYLGSGGGNTVASFIIYVACLLPLASVWRGQLNVIGKGHAWIWGEPNLDSSLGSVAYWLCGPGQATSPL